MKTSISMILGRATTVPELVEKIDAARILFGDRLNDPAIGAFAVGCFAMKGRGGYTTSKSLGRVTKISKNRKFVKVAFIKGHSLWYKPSNKDAYFEIVAELELTMDLQWVKINDRVHSS